MNAASSLNISRWAICGVLCFFSSVFARAATIESDIFVVHFPDGQSEIADYSLGVLEKGLAEYSAKLDSSDESIQLYICVTIEEFRRLGGAIAQRGVQGFANARSGVIVMKAPNLLAPGSDYGAVLRHELLHVMLARHVDPDNLPRWFNEGLAMILSRENRVSSIFQVARMYATGSIIEYEELPFVFAEPGNETEFGRAYAQSISMTKYLRSEAGDETFWAIVDDLKTKPFDQALAERTGLTPAKLFVQWKDSLWKSTLGWSILTGFSAFQFAAVLLVIAYIRKRRQTRRLLKSWPDEEEDAEIMFPWQLEGRDEPYPWEEE